MLTRPYGRNALLVEVPPRSAPADLASVVPRLADEWSLLLPVDVVPAAETVLLDGLAPDEVQAWAARLTALDVALLVAGGPGTPQRTVTVPIRYDGPDLDIVATAWDCDPADVVERHRRLTWRVAFCGFAPGFAYCLPSEPLPAVPRRTDPRERVPAGSVALAGPYCGVYPARMPGGWQLIGHTDERLFDADAQSPALLAPGDLVRFVPL